MAHGVQFPDGTVVLRWNTQTSSTGSYASIDDVVEIHGHDGSTVVVWDDEQTGVMHQHLRSVSANAN